MASSPWALNSAVQAASTAASTTGRYSGRQPAITALTATFSTVQSTRSGGTTATTSSGALDVPASMASTRSGVGGTTGNPSDHPRAYIHSHSSSAAASSRRRDRSTLPPKRTSSTGRIVGSTVSDPHPGRHGGRSADAARTTAEASGPKNPLHSSRDQPTIRPVSAPPARRMTVGTVSMSAAHDRPSSRSSTRPGTSPRKSGSSCTATMPIAPASASAATTGATSSQVGQSRLRMTTTPSSGNGAGGTGAAGVAAAPASPATDESAIAARYPSGAARDPDVRFFADHASAMPMRARAPTDRSARPAPAGHGLRRRGREPGGHRPGRRPRSAAR